MRSIADPQESLNLLQSEVSIMTQKRVLFFFFFFLIMFYVGKHLFNFLLSLLFPVSLGTSNQSTERLR